jgi:hypothetical protein
MRHLIALLATLAVLEAPAFIIPIPFPVTVVEYYNHDLGHYFMTADADEIAGIDAGVAGRGWEKTGHGFVAYARPTHWAYCSSCVAVERFYGPGPNSHFYSGGAEEVAGLRRPGTGWIYEKTAFSAHVPDANGQCAVPYYPVPVYRLYNNRWMFNDSNHRYVTSTARRDAMIAAGWIDEGARFCSASTVEVALRTHVVALYLGRVDDVLPSAECEDDSRRTGPCIAVNNLPIPKMPIGSHMTGSGPEYLRLTGSGAQALVPAMAPPHLAWQGPFVQMGGTDIGIHVDTTGKSVEQASSINPLFQFPSEGSEDSQRFYPWRSAYSFETQLAIKWSVAVHRVLTRAPGHHAYGHPTLEFIDRASGRHLYFTVLSYGTIGGGDYLAPDVFTGKVIVGTTPRRDTRYGRSLGSDWIPTEPGYDAGNGTARGGLFDFRVDRTEFRRVVDSARTIDALLSTDPDDYYLDNFHFNNEVAGDGEIGVTLGNFRLEVLRR